MAVNRYPKLAINSNGKIIEIVDMKVKPLLFGKLKIECTHLKAGIIAEYEKGLLTTGASA
ncbi:hypothetical protein TUM4445_14220 [Shewanella sp. MBTL60-112-B2]|nr:hypothetical protein TUM4444_08240 [Shewanella sp. MBTL60-112-B1]GIU30641.1 hypothetical protein TUM4445_14220 [Shewanella sp. MBTL60-112-B2]